MNRQNHEPASRLQCSGRLFRILAYCKKNTGRLICGLLAAMSLSSPAYAVRTVPVQVDGTQLPGQSYLEEGITYVPLRFLLDAFGGWNISWDSDTQQAIATSNNSDTKISADPSDDVIQINEATLTGEVSLKNGRTYIPLRLVTEALGGTAEWDPYLSGAAVTSADTDYDAMDLYWLSRIIYAESGAESMEGQIAVGNVVLNRMASPEFPESIPGVIFDRVDGIQFEPVKNGTVYKVPSARSIDAAKRVLDGENTIGSAMYFYAPALSKGIWINANRVYYKTIGCHRFYL